MAELTRLAAVADLKRIAAALANDDPEMAAVLHQVAELLEAPQTIIISGSPADGFEIYGPLTSETASYLQEEDIQLVTGREHPWWLQKLTGLDSWTELLP